MGKFISDVIGEEYKEWLRGSEKRKRLGLFQNQMTMNVDILGDIVFITSPTGSGKTTFILK